MKQKNYQNLTKNTLGKLPIWNLKDLYESPKAKNLNNDLNQLRIITKKFEKKYSFRIAKLSPGQLLKAIIELENIDIKIDKIIAGNILYVAGEALRISAILLSPVMPSRTSLLLEAFNAKKSTLNWGELQSGSIIKDHSPLFPRLN